MKRIYGGRPFVSTCPVIRVEPTLGDAIDFGKAVVREKMLKQAKSARALHDRITAERDLPDPAAVAVDEGKSGQLVWKF